MQWYRKCNIILCFNVSGSSSRIDNIICRQSISDQMSTEREIFLNVSFGVKTLDIPSVLHKMAFCVYIDCGNYSQYHTQIQGIKLFQYMKYIILWNKCFDFCFHMFRPNIWNRLKVFPPFLSHVIHQHVTFCRWVANTNGPQLGQQKTRHGIQYCRIVSIFVICWLFFWKIQISSTIVVFSW